jgi:hypothetical protein
MNNFTPRAQQVLALARKNADRLYHNFVGTEHLLLGLLQINRGVAVNILHKQGYNLDEVRIEVEKRVGIGMPPNESETIPYTPRVKKVLALAAREARALSHSYIGTEHLLLGILRDGQGNAASVLEGLGLDLHNTRKLILEELDPNFPLHPPLGIVEDAETAIKPDREKFDPRLEDHPAIRLITARLAEVDALLKKAATDKDFERTEQLTNESRFLAKEVLKEKERILKSMEQPRSPSLASILKNSFDEVSPKSMYPACKSASTVAEAVLARKSVLVVAPHQCDDTFFAGPLVTNLHSRSLASSNLEVFVLRPNHVALKMSEPEVYNRNLQESVDSLIAHHNLVLMLTDVATLLDADCMDPRIATAWQTAFNRLNANHLPFIAWTDPGGLEKIHQNWRGIFSECDLVEIYPPNAEEIAKMVSTLLRASTLSFEKGTLLPFARKLVAHCEVHAHELPWNEPERSFRVAEQFTHTAKTASLDRQPLTLRAATRLLDRITA